MKIAIVSSPIIQTPPEKYGGIERITYWLGRKLIEYGHEVALFAKSGSYLEGGKVYGYDGGGEDLEFATLAAKVDSETQFDIIHDCTHDKLLTKNFTELRNKTINSLQGMARRGPNTTCISQAQRKALDYPVEIPVVYHGIPVNEYPPIDNPKKDYFLYLGSINDYKGVDIAIDVCKRSGWPLLIAGRCWDSAYQERLIEPFLSESIKMVPEVGGQEKLELIQNARGLLHPVRWTEPGAIVISEALACGVPVIGSNNGVIPELINPAVGRICEVQHFDSYKHMSGGSYNIEQWQEAVERIDEISRDDCAEYARSWLTDDRMTTEYLNWYEALFLGGPWGLEDASS